MSIKLNFSVLHKTKWHEYGVRFLFGGAITVATGLLAKRYGPAFGGLFLAFPAIFPASATLVEKHEREKKLRAGITRSRRGRQAAALDARGAMLGSIGLAGFAIIVWKFLPAGSAAAVLASALATWLIIAVITWRLRKSRLKRRERLP